MRPEKQYLIREVNQHLDKSDYCFVFDFERVTVADVASLRRTLAPLGAEFHVVKNTLLHVATQKRGMPDMSAILNGPTAVVTGGKQLSGVAKILTQFVKEKDKGAVKGGLMGSTFVSASDVVELSKLPSIEVLRSQFLSLLNTPAQQFVRVINAVPQGVVNVLQAQVRAQSAAA